MLIQQICGEEFTTTPVFAFELYDTTHRRERCEQGRTEVRQEASLGEDLKDTDRRTPGRSRVPVHGADQATTAFVTVGSKLSDRYELVREVAAGGMGLVYEAKDRVLDERTVAIKVLPPEMASNKAAKRRLKKEALAALELTHPNIMRLHGFEEDGATSYLVMEYLDGENLEDELAERETFSVEDVLAIALQAGAALAAAHSQGVIHRDIKPANLMFTNVGGEQVVKVTDFGIAYQLKNSMTKLTGIESAGTLTYCPPELLRGEKPTSAGDQYSLGVTLFELLDGEPPFQGAGLSEQIRSASPRVIPGVPASIQSALRKAMAKDPSERFESMTAFLGALERKPLEESPGEETRATEVPRGEELAAVALPIDSAGASASLVRGGRVGPLLLLLFLGVFGYQLWPQQSGNVASSPVERDQVTQAVSLATSSPAASKARTPMPRRLRPTSNGEVRRAPTRDPVPLADPAIQDRIEEQDQDTATIVAAIRAAAHGGDRKRQFELGLCYADGLGVEKDPSQARRWIRRAAEQGVTKAQAYLGSMYSSGTGGPESPREARFWYEKAANGGDLGAQKILALRLSWDSSWGKDEVAAARFRRMAAKQGDVESQLHTAYAYQRGSGVPEDLEEAVRWFRKAAEQNDDEALYRLGQAYENGRGVAQDYTEAAQWFRKAASLGLAKAQYSLGAMYQHGLGVSKDVSEAVDWYRKAVSSGSSDAEEALRLLGK